MIEEYISTRMSDFILINDNGAVSDSTLWEPFKVVIRGHIIYQSASKKARRKRFSEIEITTLEDSYRESKSDDILNNILKIK